MLTDGAGSRKIRTDISSRYFSFNRNDGFQLLIVFLASEQEETKEEEIIDAINSPLFPVLLFLGFLLPGNELQHAISNCTTDEVGRKVSPDESRSQ